MVHTLIGVFIFVFDGFFKYNREVNKKEMDACNGHVHIMTYHNHGAFMNLGERKPAIVKLISILLTAFLSILFLVTLTRHGNHMLKIGLSILLGGAYSNTYDRLKRTYVVDYLNFPKAPGKIKNLVFNISDFAILIGSLISILRA